MGQASFSRALGHSYDLRGLCRASRPRVGCAHQLSPVDGGGLSCKRRKPAHQRELVMRLTLTACNRSRMLLPHGSGIRVLAFVFQIGPFVLWKGPLMFQIGAFAARDWGRLTRGRHDGARSHSDSAFRSPPDSGRAGGDFLPRSGRQQYHRSPSQQAAPARQSRIGRKPNTAKLVVYRLP